MLEPRLLLETLNFIVNFHRDDTMLEFLRVRRILDALAAHDPEVARSWATVHIVGVEQRLASVP